MFVFWPRKSLGVLGPTVGSPVKNYLQLSTNPKNNLCYLFIDSNLFWEARNGTELWALASHQCGPCSNPCVDTMWGLILLLALISFAPRSFTLVLQFSPHLKNQHFHTSTRCVMHWHFLTSSSELISASWITLIPSLLIWQATGSGEKSHHRKWRNLLCCTRYKTESWFFQTEIRGWWCKVFIVFKDCQLTQFPCEKHVHVKLCTLYTAVPLNSLLNYKLVQQLDGPQNRGWVLGLPFQASIAYRVCTESWILEKVLKFAQQFFRTGKSL